MPTPVSVARQCLTEPAARALDDAVSVARRRSHAQTTSLHAVSALLSLPSSTLRDALSRSRSSAYSPRLQFRALELCVGVSLDRLPSAKSIDEPPVSNSLMAAIKRSQANQRRNPESYQLQQIHASQQTTLKVELKHFVLSILDDPIVSRVFGEAGFRSCDVKMAILHPPVSLSVSRGPRMNFPPIFLCNLPGSEDCGDGNSKRIGEVLVRKVGRSPLLVGVCASDALRGFVDSLRRGKGKGGDLPGELGDLGVLCIGEDVREFVGKEGSEEKMRVKFKEVEEALDRCGGGSGLVVSFGELKELVREDVSSEGVGYVVGELTRLFERYAGQMWLMGAAESYETYSKFLGKFPSVQKDWDLHLLPITSSKTSFEGVYPKSSLMGSFVPFGGFFSTPSDSGSPVSSITTNISRCNACNQKYEIEVAAIRRLGSTSSVAEQHSSSLPSWLQTSELDTAKGTDAGKAKDEAATMDARISGLQKKYNDICQRLHHTPQVPKLLTPQAISAVRPDGGLQYTASLKESSSNFPLNLTRSPNASPSTPTNVLSPSKQRSSISAASGAMNVINKCNLSVKHWRSQQIETENPEGSVDTKLNDALPPDQASSLSPVSVTTDLGLGTIYASTSEQPKSSRLQVDTAQLQQISGSVSAETDTVAENSSNLITRSSSCSGPNLEEQLDMHDFKTLWRALSEKVSSQGEAVHAISETISRHRTGNGKQCGFHLKKNVWLTFLGPDKMGKRKMASMLAEVIFGSGESLVTVDLSPRDRLKDSNSIFGCLELNDNDLRFRGKTVVDYIAGELSRRPHSVVLLENVDKADLLAQSSLSQAIRTGKFPDSHGREISINNMIVAATSSTAKEKCSSFVRSRCDFSEEKILGAKNWQMKLSIGSVTDDAQRCSGTNVRVTSYSRTSHPLSSNKRKLEGTDLTNQEKASDTKKQATGASRSYLDLNLPVEGIEEDIAGAGSDSDSISENSRAWLEDFFDHVDRNVVFKPFDFDALAQKIVREIGVEFQNAFGHDCDLEIDREVLVQVLAAAWSSESKAVDNWVRQVLGTSFLEAKKKLHLPIGSVMELVHCEGIPVKEQASSVPLPASIHMN